MVTTTAVGGHQLDNAIVDLLLSDFQRWALFRNLHFFFFEVIFIIQAVEGGSPWKHTRRTQTKNGS